MKVFEFDNAPYGIGSSTVVTIPASLIKLASLAEGKTYKFLILVEE